MTQADPEQSVEDLIEQIRTGGIEEQKGYAKLYGTMSPYIGKVITSVMHSADRQEVDDLVSTTWEAIWENIESFDSAIASFETWAGRIARYKAIDHLRSKKARPSPVELDKPMPDDTPFGEVIEDPSERDPLEEVTEKRIQAAALSALMELPAFDRTLYLLYLTFDLSHEELAEIASKAQGEQITDRAVQGRIYRTRDKMLASLRDQEIID